MNPAPSLDDIRHDIGQLYRLLQVAVGIVIEMPHVLNDGRRDEEMDQLDALLCIARNMAKKTTEDADAHLAEAFSTRRAGT